MATNPFGSLTFNGSTQYGSVSHHADYNFGASQSFCVELWFKTAAAAPLMNKFASSKGWKLAVTSGGALSGTINTSTLSGGTSLLNNAWHHAALSVDQDMGVAFLCLDGAVVDQVDISAISTTDNTAAIRFATNESVTTFLNGSLQEVRISQVSRYGGDYIIPTFQFFEDGFTLLLLHFNEGNGATSFDMSRQRHRATLTASPTYAEGNLIVSPVTVVREHIWLAIDEDSDVSNYFTRTGGVKFRLAESDPLPTPEVLAGGTASPALIVAPTSIGEVPPETVAYHTVPVSITIWGYLFHTSVAEIEAFWFLILRAIYRRYDTGQSGGRLECNFIQRIEIRGPDFMTETGAAERQNTLFSVFSFECIADFRIALAP